ncbi:MAG: V-type ATP synthase subunit E [Spirochaetaceae bacterium]|jgi:V/A-type H+-transporting ATPase subunit E|nr:V-type ATP synthase subunit E [Spirochaetaceae bacterium]
MMDIQLHELIEKIKKDGIEGASEEASRLKAEAESEAKRILGAAKKEAADIIAKAKADAERAEKAGIAAIGQASRNAVLVFKSKIQELLDLITRKETAAAYSADTLKTVLPDIIRGWVSKGEELAVILPPRDLDSVEAFLRDKLASELQKGLEIKTGRGLEGGFTISNRDGSAYYDFSVEAVAELFSAYLNPRLAEVLKTAVKEE